MLKQIEKDLILISIYSVKRKYKLLKDYLAGRKFNKKESLKIYETVLQTYLLAGFPSALVSLKLISNYIKVPLINNKINNNNFYAIGIKNLSKIYENKSDKLLNNIKTFSPEMSQWLVTEGYGKVFSRGILSLRERELGFCSILIALKFEDQLISHFHGALRNKVTVKEINEMIELLIIKNFKKDAEFGKKVISMLF